MENTHPDAVGTHDTGSAPGAVVRSVDDAVDWGHDRAIPDHATPDDAGAVIPDYAVPDRTPDDVPVGDAPVGDRPAADTSTARRSVDDIERLLDEVEAALGRLDDGTYGRCSSCNSPITDERLAASPTAARCATCDPSGREG